MKEATGELNMTVITVVAIAAIAALFTAFVWPNIKKSIKTNTVCSNGPDIKIGNLNEEGYVNCGPMNASGDFTCNYYLDATTKNDTVTCHSKNK